MKAKSAVSFMIELEIYRNMHVNTEMTEMVLSSTACICRSNFCPMLLYEHYEDSGTVFSVFTNL